jgi:hypothetical protein
LLFVELPHGDPVAALDVVVGDAQVWFGVQDRLVGQEQVAIFLLRGGLDRAFFDHRRAVEYGLAGAGEDSAIALPTAAVRLGVHHGHVVVDLLAAAGVIHAFEHGFGARAGKLDADVEARQRTAEGHHVRPVARISALANREPADVIRVVRTENHTRVQEGRVPVQNDLGDAVGEVALARANQVALDELGATARLGEDQQAWIGRGGLDARRTHVHDVNWHADAGALAHEQDQRVVEECCVEGREVVARVDAAEVLLRRPGVARGQVGDPPDLHAGGRSDGEIQARAPVHDRKLPGGVFAEGGASPGRAVGVGARGQGVAIGEQRGDRGEAPGFSPPGGRSVGAKSRQSGGLELLQPGGLGCRLADHDAALACAASRMPA